MFDEPIFFHIIMSDIYGKHSLPGRNVWEIMSLTSGKRLQKTMEQIHHFDGKTHDFNGYIAMERSSIF